MATNIASFLFSILISIFLAFSGAIALCTPDSKDPSLKNEAEIAAHSRISSLDGLKWEWDVYTLSICFDELWKHKNAGAVWRSPTGEIVLGRVNRSHALSGDHFVLLEYRGGDHSTIATCQGNFSAQLYIVCNDHFNEGLQPKFLELSGCVARFELMTPMLCPPVSPPVAPMVFVWIIFVFSLYCISGILYRRFSLQARGCQQLPHFNFWSRIGGGCADVCNWACRCEEEPTISSWDPSDDRDDVLLRP